MLKTFVREILMTDANGKKHLMLISVSLIVHLCNIFELITAVN